MAELGKVKNILEDLTQHSITDETIEKQIKLYNNRTYALGFIFLINWRLSA